MFSGVQKYKKSPIHERLVEDVVSEGVVDLAHERRFHAAEVLRAGVVGVAREGLVEVLRVVKTVGEAHAHGDGQAVHCGGLVALDGHGRDVIVDDFALQLVVAVGGDNRQRGLSLYLVFERRGEALAERGVHQRGIVLERGDGHSLGARIDRAARQRHRHPAARKEQQQGHQRPHDSATARSHCLVIVHIP